MVWNVPLQKPNQKNRTYVLYLWFFQSYTVYFWEEQTEIEVNIDQNSCLLLTVN